MKLWNQTHATVTRSRMLAPVFSGVQGGLCPEQARRRVDGPATPLSQDIFVIAAGNGTVMGHRPWSPPIT